MASARVPGFAEFDSLLTAGVDAANTLLALLEDERAALAAADSDALTHIAGAKHDALGKLESIEASRQKAVARAGSRDDAGSLRQLYDQCDPSGRLARHWADYLAIAERCRDANLTNGAVIRMRHQHLSQALAAIAGDRPQTYGPSGHGRGGASRPLAEA